MVVWTGHSFEKLQCLEWSVCNLVDASSMVFVGMLRALQNGPGKHAGKARPPWRQRQGAV